MSNINTSARVGRTCDFVLLSLGKTSVVIFFNGKRAVNLLPDLTGVTCEVFASISHFSFTKRKVTMAF